MDRKWLYSILIFFLLLIAIFAFASTTSESRPWWLGDLLTVFSIISGALLILYQLSCQHKKELELQKENFREKLRLEVFQEFSKLIATVTDNCVQAEMCARHTYIHLQTYHEQIKCDHSPQPLSDRAINFNNIHFNTVKSIIDLTCLIERYLIISPELNIFKQAFQVTLEELIESGLILFGHMLRMLPADLPMEDGRAVTVNVRAFSDEEIVQFGKKMEAYCKQHGDLTGYLIDFNTELQNTLLSGLFDRKLPKRMPLNGHVKVITTEREEIARLQRYFEEETTWGKKKKAYEEEFRKNTEDT